MKPRTIALLAAAGALAFMWGTAPVAGALPACGGNQHQWQAPMACQNSRTIDGTLVTVTITETAAGAYTAHYHLATPRGTDSIVHSTSHIGISSRGGPTYTASATIPAGQQDATLFLPQTFCGQVDNRAIFDTPAGRVSGPWINNNSCAPPVTTTTTVPSSSSTSVPSTTRPTGSTSSVQTTLPGTIGTAPRVPGTIPQTGSDLGRPFAVATAALVAGLGLIVAGRRRAVR